MELTQLDSMMVDAYNGKTDFTPSRLMRRMDILEAELIEPLRIFD